MHRWAEVVARNDAGGCWVVMDGMVFDLEAWLPEHPGGATIIPAQALNRTYTNPNPNPNLNPNPNPNLN